MHLIVRLGPGAHYFYFCFSLLFFPSYLLIFIKLFRFCLTTVCLNVIYFLFGSYTSSEDVERNKTETENYFIQYFIHIGKLSHPIRETAELAY